MNKLSKHFNKTLENQLASMKATVDDLLEAVDNYDEDLHSSLSADDRELIVEAAKQIELAIKLIKKHKKAADLGRVTKAKKNTPPHSKRKK